MVRFTRTGLRALAALALTAMLAVPAGSAEAKGKASKHLSVGAPNRGTLTGGVRLKSSKHLMVKTGARTWGLRELTRALQRAAVRVNKKHGRSVLLVGDLSKKGGGQLDGHHSHQTGRDADVGFYATNSRGKPVNLKRFVAFDAEGKSKGEPSWPRFDDARNWTFVEALLTDKDANVRYLFVSRALRARLLAYAAKKKVAQEIVDRAAAAMVSPKEAELHDDHFHVRIACPESMRGSCQEESFARGGARVAGAKGGGAKGGDVKGGDDPYE